MYSNILVLIFFGKELKDSWCLVIVNYLCTWLSLYVLCLGNSMFQGPLVVLCIHCVYSWHWFCRGLCKQGVKQTHSPCLLQLYSTFKEVLYVTNKLYSLDIQHLLFLYEFLLIFCQLYYVDWWAFNILRLTIWQWRSMFICKTQF